MLKFIKFKYTNGEAYQIRFFDIPILQFEISKNKGIHRFKIPLLRKLKKDKTIFYLKINSNNYLYSLFCLYHWLNTVNEIGADYYILCDDRQLEYKLLDCMLFPNDNVKFIRSNRKKYKNIVKVSCTKKWENAAYAHLTTYLHAKKHGIKEFWNIDADDTIFFEKVDILAKTLEKISDYAKKNNYHSFSLDMHRSAFRGLQWTFGITFTQMNVDLDKIFSKFTNKQWQYEYHCKVMNSPKDNFESNLDTFFTYLKDKKLLNIGTFNVKNLYFIHWGNCFMDYLFRAIQVTKDDNYMHYPFLKSIDSNKANIPMAKDVVNLDTRVDEKSSKEFMQLVLLSFDKRIQGIRDRYDTTEIKEQYEHI